MATVCVNASINRLHNIQKLLMALYIYIYAGKRGRERGRDFITVKSAREGKNARGGHK